MFFRFPPDARWNPERSVVEFGIGVGEYEGVVRVSRRGDLFRYCVNSFIRSIREVPHLLSMELQNYPHYKSNFKRIIY